MNDTQRWWELKLHNHHIRSYASMMCPNETEYGDWCSVLAKYLEWNMRRMGITFSDTDMRKAIILMRDKTLKRSGEKGFINYLCNGMLNESEVPTTLTDDKIAVYENILFGKKVDGIIPKQIINIMHSTLYFESCNSEEDALKDMIQNYHNYVNSYGKRIIVAIVAGTDVIDELERLSNVKYVDIESTIPLRFKVQFSYDSNLIESICGASVKEIYSVSDTIIKKFANTLPVDIRSRIKYNELLRAYIYIKNKEKQK